MQVLSVVWLTEAHRCRWGHGHQREACQKDWLLWACALIVECRLPRGLDGLWRQGQVCLRDRAISERQYGCRGNVRETDGSQVEGFGEPRHIEGHLVLLVLSRDDHSLEASLKGWELRFRHRIWPWRYR